MAISVDSDSLFCATQLSDPFDKTADQASIRSEVSTVGVSNLQQVLADDDAPFEVLAGCVAPHLVGDRRVAT